jgi:hypothetical protein
VNACRRSWDAKTGCCFLSPQVAGRDTLPVCKMYFKCSLNVNLSFLRTSILALQPESSCWFSSTLVMLCCCCNDTRAASVVHVCMQAARAASAALFARPMCDRFITFEEVWSALIHPLTLRDVHSSSALEGVSLLWHSQARSCRSSTRWDYRRKDIALVSVRLAALFRAPLLPRASCVLAGRYATIAQRACPAICLVRTSDATRVFVRIKSSPYGCYPAKQTSKYGIAESVRGRRPRPPVKENS